MGHAAARAQGSSGARPSRTQDSRGGEGAARAARAVLLGLERPAALLRRPSRARAVTLMVAPHLSHRGKKRPPASQLLYMCCVAACPPCARMIHELKTFSHTRYNSAKKRAVLAPSCSPLTQILMGTLTDAGFSSSSSSRCIFLPVIDGSTTLEYRSARRASRTSRGRYKIGTVGFEWASL